MKKSISFLIAASLLLLSSCSYTDNSIGNITLGGDTDTANSSFIGDNNEGIFSYQTEDLIYNLHYDDYPQHITITGIIYERQTDFDIPAEIDTVAVTAIGGDAFSYSEVTNISLPASLISIGKYAFYNCAGLKNITLPEGLTEIGDYAFYYCTLLSEVTIPSLLKRIGGLVFNHTPWFDSLSREFEIFGDGILLDYNGEGGDVSLPEGVKFISSAFYGNENITSVLISSDTEVIGAAAFMNCTVLSNITLPDGLTEIGDSAFRGCSSLSELTIPESVTLFGFESFADCPNLTLRVKRGSPAEKYAADHGINYTAE